MYQQLEYANHFNSSMNIYIEPNCDTLAEKTVHRCFHCENWDNWHWYCLSLYFFMIWSVLVSFSYILSPSHVCSLLKCNRFAQKENSVAIKWTETVVMSQYSILSAFVCLFSQIHHHYVLAYEYKLCVMYCMRLFADFEYTRRVKYWIVPNQIDLQNVDFGCGS